MGVFIFQHVDVAALLIKYNACVNATDKWAFTPLHEAAQKGRTQLCALLLAHGADPTLKNQEGQTPLDLVTVSDGALLGKSVLLFVAARLKTVLFKKNSNIATNAKFRILWFLWCLYVPVRKVVEPL